MEMLRLAEESARQTLEREKAASASAMAKANGELKKTELEVARLKKELENAKSSSGAAESARSLRKSTM
jgi:hypothetical protein